MRVTVGITTAEGADVSATVQASGRYAPDVMNDLANRANTALREAYALQSTEPAVEDAE